ncbi:leader peptidase (prepilin peptidase)/N-methyltransferase [Streptomyces sp. TLI_235]|nr:A24 family peptidase [Streptomyces sp. TLI_235]PBC78047.1 leader peptidase (prepilin peptidase)/N-methyltransferase [Streptomyces sp. TLI_235]
MIGPWAGALLGLAAAPLLRAAAVRHAVPYGEPPHTCCPAGRWRRWPGGRCPGCGETAAGPRPGAVEAVAAAVGAALGAAADAGSAPLFCWVGLFGVVLGFVDAAVLRLPDALTLPLFAGTAVLLPLADHRPQVLLRCVLAAAALGLLYGALALLLPIGLGDAKLAPSLGAVLGLYGWSAVAGGVFAAFLLGGVWGMVLLATRRAGRGDALPFGPPLLLGALVAVLAAA